MDATFFCALKRKSPKKRSPHGSAGLPPGGCAGALAACQRRAASETRATRSNRRSPSLPPLSTRLGAPEGGFAPLIPIPHGYRSIELVIASEAKQSMFLKKLKNWIASSLRFSQ